jgi:two-component system nitrogen regulation response regulator GlnG
MPHVLVVDDEPSICWGLARLGKLRGYDVAVAASAEEGLASVVQKRPDVIVLDVRLPGMDGLTAIDRFREKLGPVPVILITAYGELSTAVAAVRAGAFDYLIKPFDLQVAERTIERALQSSELGQPTPRPDATPEDTIVGGGPAMQEVFKRIALAAASDACVHLHGESGTGKELVARAIHRYSRRAEGPFVAAHVASLAPSLAESELFGHVRGAFTGADQLHQGLLERAHGGTVFLDEVADIPPSIQVKLLRSLEYGEVLPVGASRPISVDFRIISATHRNLLEQVAEQKFRHDLYFRLVTFEIELPPLRQRREDIPLLADRFLGLLAAKHDGPRPLLSPAALAELERRPWYGNVRELRNALEHATILGRGGILGPEHLPPPAPPTTVAGEGLEEQIIALVRRWARSRLADAADSGDLHAALLRTVEPPMLREVIEHYHGQCAAAARRLGLHRTTLRKKLDELDIRTDER